MRFNLTKVRDWWFDKDYKFVIPIKIILDQDYAGKVKCNITIPICKWMRRGSLNREVVRVTPSGDPNGVHYSTNVNIDLGQPLNNPPKVGDLRIYNYKKVNCVGSPDNPCAYTKVLQARVTDNGRRGRGVFQNWSHSVTVTYKAYIEKYEHVDDKVRETKDQNIYYSGDFELKVPKNFTALNIFVSMANGKESIVSVARDVSSEIVPVVNNIQSEFLEYLSHETKANEIVYRFRVKKDY
jgi:hypothetical protein